MGADRWLSVAEIAALLGLSEKSVLRLRRRGIPLRQLTPRGRAGALESELLAWIKRQPPLGRPVQHIS